MKKLITLTLLAILILPAHSQTFKTIGDQYINGKLSIYPTGTTPDNTYNGNLVITKPAASGQYINLTKKGNSAWSIGTVYNQNSFAIGSATTADVNFTSPVFVISTLGNVGIGTTDPSTLLEVAATSGNGIRIGKIGDTGNLNVSKDSLTAQYNIDFSGYRNVVLDQIGARISALRFNGHVENSALVQKTGLGFYTNPTGNYSGATGLVEQLRIMPNGNVGVGYLNPQYKLDVKGTIRATEVKVVSVDQFADFVFDSAYELPKLKDVDSYIQTNGHLPEIPSAKDVKENGVSLVEMQVKLLQKVEELTLYAIEQQKRIEQLEQALKNAKK
jgi:hypothetical protein